ncbi:MAG: PHP domain-containing protein [Euryarchaeota archaeon]|nr:PHP domain-containing protein [Euryarchaeota archaeon]
MRLDLHVHSCHSPDSKLDPVDLLKVAKQRGLDGVAITDHNAVEGARKAWEFGRHRGILVVRGTEVSTEDGHVLAYGVVQPIARNRCGRDTVEDILALGGVPVAAHPYRFWSGLGEAETIGAPFVAYEVQNARTLGWGNVRAHSLAARQHLPGIGGSDAHFLHEVGRAVTLVEDASTEDEVLEAIRHGQVRAEGRDRGATATVRYVTKCVGEWILRGMRRI